jgi:hypothetical protein
LILSLSFALVQRCHDLEHPDLPTRDKPPNVSLRLEAKE